MYTIQSEPYLQAKEHWPKEGRYVYAQYDEDSIIVYQAFSDQIAHYACTNNCFTGAPGYQDSRMSWIKTNYLWMMHRSGWGKKKNQNHILAIWLTREYFEEILRNAVPSHNIGDMTTNKRKKLYQEQGKKGAIVRLQWDPDHHPSGAKVTRKAIQLGLKGKMQLQNQEGILHIKDITQWVRENKWTGNADDLIVPKERIYPIPSDIASIIGTSE